MTERGSFLVCPVAAGHLIACIRIEKSHTELPRERQPRKMPRISRRRKRNLRYNAPHAYKLRTHDEDLSTKLNAQNIDPRNSLAV